MLYAASRCAFAMRHAALSIAFPLRASRGALRARARREYICRKSGVALQRVDDAAAAPLYGAMPRRHAARCLTI